MVAFDRLRTAFEGLFPHLNKEKYFQVKYSRKQVIFLLPRVSAGIVLEHLESTLANLGKRTIAEAVVIIRRSMKAAG